VLSEEVGAYFCWDQFTTRKDLADTLRLSGEQSRVCLRSPLRNQIKPVGSWWLNHLAYYSGTNDEGDHPLIKANSDPRRMNDGDQGPVTYYLGEKQED